MAQGASARPSAPEPLTVSDRPALCALARFLLSTLAACLSRLALLVFPIMSEASLARVSGGALLPSGSVSARW